MITNLVVTAYCACSICCGPHPSGLTASGKKPIEGITVAASRQYPFGTRLMIEGHTYIVQDRLAKRYDDRVDIYFSKHKDAKKFGLKHESVDIKLPLAH
jgi:3D (Asp-Asp-Asp) domain-containing protein